MSELNDQQSYTRVRETFRTTRTIQINDRTLVDISEDGRVLGIETLSGQTVDWFAILADDRFRFLPIRGPGVRS